MREITYKLYQFKELAPDVQEKIIERSRDMNVDYDWWRPTIDMLADMARVLGVHVSVSRNAPDIYFSGFNHQGSGACFEGSYEYEPQAISTIESEYPTNEQLKQIANQLDDIQKKCKGLACATVKKTTHQYSHERTVDIDTYLDIPMEPPEDIEESMAREVNDDVSRALRELMRYMYRVIEEEHDYLQSDGCIRESLENDDTEYLACGRHAP